MILSSIIVYELLTMLENIAKQFWPVSSAKGEPWVNRVLRKIQTPDLDTEFAMQTSAIKKPQQNKPKIKLLFFTFGRVAFF